MSPQAEMNRQHVLRAAAGAGHNLAYLCLTSRHGGYSGADAVPVALGALKLYGQPVVAPIAAILE